MAKQATDLTKRILDVAKQHPRVACLEKFNGGMFKVGGRTIRAAPNGWPDIAGFLTDGRALLVEVKAEGDKPRPSQVAMIEQAQQAGCAAGFARSVDDFLRIVEGG